MPMAERDILGAPLANDEVARHSKRVRAERPRLQSGATFKNARNRLLNDVVGCIRRIDPRGDERRQRLSQREHVRVSDVSLTLSFQHACPEAVALFQSFALTSCDLCVMDEP
jgi:hypothetical protein